MIDRREEFKNKYWYVGKFIDSPKYNHWLKDDKDRAIEVEQHRIYINPLHYDAPNLDIRDILKTRILIYVCETKEECVKAVKTHNNKIREHNDRVKRNTRT